MNSSAFQSAYKEQNRRDFIAAATLGTAICIPLNLLCLFMDHLMYPDKAPLFVKARIISVLATGLGWLWFKSKTGRAFPRFEVMWFFSPQVMILWMIYAADDQFGIYYAGLNIVLLGMGLLTPWAYGQNLAMCIFTLAVYLVISFSAENPQPAKYILNNVTFLFLTSALVVSGSVASARQRLREFTLRYQLDQSKRTLETTNLRLGEQNLALENANREIKETEMQLVQSEKMSSLGRFSAGLMHDILNPLNYSRTGLYVLRKKTRKLPPELIPETDTILNDIEDGLKRVDNIVSDLRTFTHPGAQASEDVDLADIFELSLRFVSSELKEHNISLKLNLEPGQTVWASRNHFTLVLVNLLENAIDALGEKNFTNGDQPMIEITGRTEGERSLLFFRDNGLGITPQNLAKIFDPFFTTKEVGKGTGLGLSICFGIVRGYGGTISAMSEPGEFCEFTVDLPATAEAADKTKPANAQPLRL
jgi:two-component system, sensor histidine kinase PhcS